MATGGTTQARFEVARHNEALVRAEAGLKGEREVTRIRLGLMLARIVAIPAALWVVHDETHLELGRGLVLLGYLIFSITTFFGMRRAKASIEGAERGPAVFALLDTAWVVAMTWFASDHQITFQREVSALGLALIISYSAPRGRATNAIFSTIVATIGFIAVALICWYRGEPANPVVVVMVSLSLGGMGYLSYRVAQQTSDMFVAVRKRDNLSRYLPRQVVDRLMSLDDTALAPAKREVTILFSDLRDFTATCETMDPRSVLELLDFYFGHMSQIVKAHSGMVNKFIGDGMLAVWGAPEPDPEHALAAVKAALDMRKKLAEINSERRGRGEYELRMGIGVHTGIAAVGGIGGAEQIEYTVLGDAVNLASRIEGLNKVHGTDLLISGSTWERIDGRFRGDRVGEEHVKGRAESVVIYSIEG